MNKSENEKRALDRGEILDLLSRRITGDGEGRPASFEPLRHVLPRDLSIVLDDLLRSAATGLGLDPADTYSKVIEMGIVSWYCDLSEGDRERIGFTDGDLLGGAICDRRSGQLQLSLNSDPQAVALVRTKPATTHHDDDDLEDPNPAAAQQKADAYAFQTGAFGYTPMTIHALANGGNKGPNHSSHNGLHSGKKRRPPTPQEGGGGRRNKKNRGRKRSG